MVAAIGRAAEVITDITPTAAAKNFEFSDVGSGRIAVRAYTVIVSIIPVINPFPHITCHIVNSIGTLPGIKESHGSAIFKCIRQNIKIAVAFTGIPV
jgi:hypothetical protein